MQVPGKTHFFRFVVKSHLDLDWHKRTAKGGWKMAEDYVKKNEGRVIDVHLEAGDYLMFDSRTVHTPVIVSEANNGPRCEEDKMVIYLCWGRKHDSRNDQHQAAKRLAYADRGWVSRHFPIGFRRESPQLPAKEAARVTEKEAEQVKKYIHRERWHVTYGGHTFLEAADPNSDWYFCGRGDLKNFCAQKNILLPARKPEEGFKCETCKRAFHTEHNKNAHMALCFVGRKLANKRAKLSVPKFTLKMEINSVNEGEYVECEPDVDLTAAKLTGTLKVEASDPSTSSAAPAKEDDSPAEEDDGRYLCDYCLRSFKSLRQVEFHEENAGCW